MKKIGFSFFLFFFSYQIQAQSLIEYDKKLESVALFDSYQFYSNQELIFARPTDERNNILGTLITPQRYGFTELSTANIYYLRGFGDIRIGSNIALITNNLYYEIQPTIKANYEYEKLIVGASVDYTQMTIRDQASNNNVKINLGAGLKVGDDLKFGFNINNLLNSNYTDNTQAARSSRFGAAYKLDNIGIAVDLTMTEKFGAGIQFVGLYNVNEDIIIRGIYLTKPETLAIEGRYNFNYNSAIINFSYQRILGAIASFGYSYNF